MTSNAILSTTSNARTARGVSPFGILAAFDGFCRLVADTYDPPQIPTIAESSPRPRIRESLAPILPSTAAVGTLWLGAALARDERAAGHAAAAIPQNESQGPGIRPGASGEHTTGNKRAAAAPSVARAREQLHSSSAAPTAKQAKNKPCSSRSAPRRSRPWPRPAPPSRCDA